VDHLFVERSDLVSLHLPVLPETRGLVDARFLEKIRFGAYLINTAAWGAGR
jgi:phosphoglycerate dehydrogenase-like enzyme